MKKHFVALILSLSSIPFLTNTSGVENVEAIETSERNLNIVTTFDITETATYGVPNAFQGRFNSISTKVASAYAENFSINLNFTIPTTNYVLSSCAYECRQSSGNYNAYCNHAMSANCNNAGPLHHTNCGVIKADVADIPNDGYNLHVTAVSLCNVDESTGSHGGINGMHYSSRFILLRDYDYVKQTDVLNPSYCDVTYVSKTLAHEIGHIFGVNHHYASGVESCIWGRGKDDIDVAENLYMCTACRVTILMNSNEYFS